MEEKPPPKWTWREPEALEIDRTGIEEAQARQATPAPNLELRKQIAERQTSRAETEKAVKEMTDAQVNWRTVKWNVFKSVLFLLLSFFLLTAITDFVNFIAGVNIILSGLKQIVILGFLYIGAYSVRNRLSQDQLARVWNLIKAVLGPLFLAALIYVLYRGIRGFSGIIAYRTKSGVQWNYPFLYFLCFLAAVIVTCVWLMRQRRKAAQAIYEIEYGAPDGEGPMVSRDQLRLVKYCAEGMIANLVLMALFQFTYGVDVPRGLVNGLRQPFVFLFYFFPFLSYVFFRKYIGSLIS